MRIHKIQILNKIKRNKRSITEANYTVTIEKVPYKANKWNGIKEYSMENYIHYNYNYDTVPNDLDFENYDYYDSVMTKLKPDLNTMKLDVSQVRIKTFK